jgi:hypothetical protein
LELKNPTEDYGGPNYDYFHADLYISFYSDASCTVPYSLPNNIRFRWRDHVTTADVYNPAGSSIDNDYDFDVMAGSDSYLFQPGIETSGYEEFAPDPDLGTAWFTINHDYSLLISPATNIQPYTVYTEKPTYIAAP